MNTTKDLKYIYKKSRKETERERGREREYEYELFDFASRNVYLHPHSPILLNYVSPEKRKKNTHVHEVLLSKPQICESTKKC